jgi:hypothetical protein
MEQENNIFYHYTSVSALYKIVTNKTLLLSGVQSLNDMEEATYSVKDFENDFKTLYESQKYDFINYLYENAFLPKKDDFEKLAEPEIEPFVFSLSKRRDSLAHWDRYADTRKGVCIGIDITKLNDISFIEMGFVQVNSIIYNEKQKLEYLLKTIKDKVLRESPIQILPENYKDLFYKDMGYTLISDCYRQMKYYVKKDLWEEEGEMRIAYEDTITKDTFSQIPHLQEVHKNLIFPDMNTIFKQSGLDTLKFELINNKIRPCRFLDISSIWDKGLITEVMLGPKCEQSKKDLELFLNSNGLKNVRITESSIKIR